MKLIITSPHHPETVTLELDQHEFHIDPDDAAGLADWLDSIGADGTGDFVRAMADVLRTPAPERYVIAHGDTSVYWNNEFGWVDYDNAERFHTVDTTSLRLPLGGRWVRVSS